MKKPRDLPAPSSSTSTIGPIIGVVDGSNAAPGEVGEFLTATGVANFAAYPAVTSTTVNLINMPPGDWDFWVSALVSTNIGGLFFSLGSPPPTGMSNAMSAFTEEVSVNPVLLEVGFILDGQNARGSFAVVTDLTFKVLVDQSRDPSLLAGTVTMRIEARRRR